MTPENTASRGLLIVLVGPSGVGKGTLAAQVLQRLGPRARGSISATTRPTFRHLSLLWPSRNSIVPMRSWKE